MIRFVKMEKKELTDNQIFNIIEEIEDIIDNSQDETERDMEIAKSN